MCNWGQRRGRGGVILAGLMRNSSHRSCTSAELRELLGNDEGADKLRRSLDVAAASDLTLLLSGESGVGTSLIAEWIHHRSSRAHAPLATIDPSRMSPLAFATDLAMLTPGGTLVIDDVATLTPRGQDVLFRHLDCGWRPPMPEQLPARIIVATRQNLYAEVLAGRFRHDLFYRLNLIHLEIVPGTVTSVCKSEQTLVVSGITLG